MTGAPNPLLNADPKTADEWRTQAALIARIAEDHHKAKRPHHAQSARVRAKACLSRAEAIERSDERRVA